MKGVLGGTGRYQEGREAVYRRGAQARQRAASSNDPDGGPDANERRGGTNRYQEGREAVYRSVRMVGPTLMKGIAE